MPTAKTALQNVLRRLRLLPLARGLQGLVAKTRVSETSRCRDSLAPFCQGDGLDIGYGGDPIVPHAICMDLPQPYAQYQAHPQHLHGDARDLHWFRDGSLDFVYSSHVLEDFEDTETVLLEWARVLKEGGHLVLYLPDEPTYRAHCEAQGQPPNAHHVHDDFGPQTLRRIAERHSHLTICHQRFPVGIYSFEMVLRKGSGPVEPSPAA